MVVYLGGECFGHHTQDIGSDFRNALLIAVFAHQPQDGSTRTCHSFDSFIY